MFLASKHGSNDVEQGFEAQLAPREGGEGSTPASNLPLGFPLQLRNPRVVGEFMFPLVGPVVLFSHHASRTGKNIYNIPCGIPLDVHGDIHLVAVLKIAIV